MFSYFPYSVATPKNKQPRWCWDVVSCMPGIPIQDVFRMGGVLFHQVWSPCLKGDLKVFCSGVAIPVLCQVVCCYEFPVIIVVCTFLIISTATLVTQQHVCWFLGIQCCKGWNVEHHILESVVGVKSFGLKPVSFLTKRTWSTLKRNESRHNDKWTWIYYSHCVDL